jgi:hypothetical protein
LLALEAALYALLTFRPRSLQYIDYVDGYYLYVAHRMAQGAVLYRDVQGVQPPLLFVAGALLFRLHDSLAVIRLYALLVHLCIQMLVLLSAYRLYRSQALALIAATLFALAPYSWQWDRIFDPNPLVTLLTLASFYALLLDRTEAALLAGVLGGLAMVTKIWYLPVLVVSVAYLARNQPARLPRFLFGLVLTLGIVCLLGWSQVGAAFWQGLLAQDVSPLSLDWLDASIVHVLSDETPLLLAALAGLLLIARGRVGLSPLPALYGLSSVLVLGATIKQGTAWPVFQFAEPALVLLATALIVPLPTREGGAGSRVRSSGVLPAILLLLMAAWSLPAIRAAIPASDSSEHVVTSAIQRYAPPDAILLAPPFYLYLTHRRAFAEDADINLWELADRSGNSSASAARQRLVQALRRGAVPIVVVDQRVDRLQGVLPTLSTFYRALSFVDPLPPDRAVQLWLSRSTRPASP